MNPNEILTLLQICDLSKEWPELRPIHDKAMDKLRKSMAEPAETPKPSNGPRFRPVSSGEAAHD